MKILKPFTSRRFNYALAALLILAVNGNALAEPVTEKVQYYYSHRREVAAQYGTWDTTKRPSPVRNIHAALLRTGKVLLIAGSGNDEKNFDAKSFRSVLWDPETNEFTDIPTPWDAFCAGHVFLPNGNLLVAGGTAKYEDLTVQPKQDYEGLKDSYEFNPLTERYEKVDSMDFARWYPTLVALKDGKILSSSGLDENGFLLNGQTEIYDPATKEWTERKDLNRYLPTYPALFLMADGQLFYSGSTDGYGDPQKGRTPGLWNLNDNSFKEVPGLPDKDIVETSTSVLLPPAQDQKVMILGGGAVGDSPVTTDRTAIADLDEENPQYVQGPNLNEGMRYPNAVILPNDTVLQTGGSRDYRADDILEANIYDPKTNKFTKAANPTIGRNYHSQALLLPDGRVATFGSNPLDNSFEMRIEIYSPAYLYKDTPRPVIKGGEKELTWGSTTELKTSNPSDIQKVKLMRPSAVTHVTDVEQRSVDLDFTRTKDGVTIQVPDNQGLLPAGWYMAFATDKHGVPSKAYWVHVD
jgi:hypothetical protein